jgi:hypothetical protein
MTDGGKPSRIPMPVLASFGCSGPVVRRIPEDRRALFYSRHDELRRGRFPIARVRNRLGSLSKAVHQAIVTAKMRRLRNELTFHAGAHENWMDVDVTKVLQRPLILADKWDF